VAEGRDLAAQIVWIIRLLKGWRLPVALRAACLALVAAGVTGPDALYLLEEVAVHEAPPANLLLIETQPSSIDADVN
jgi:hypothetical protein